MRPEIRFVMLANHAECPNGLLYMSGAGWTDLWAPPAPPGETPMCHFGIVVQVVVPWTETNKPHASSIRIENEDGSVVFEVQGPLEIGRPAGAVAGSEQHHNAVVDVVMPFPAPGGYRVVATVEQHVKGYAFRVHSAEERRLAG